MKKYVILFVLFILILTSCSNQSTGTTADSRTKETIDRTEYSYEITFHKINSDKTWNNSMLLYGDSIFIIEEYYYSKPLSCVSKINLSTGEVNDFSFDLPDTRTIRGGVQVNNQFILFSEDYVPDEKNPDYGLYAWNGGFLTWFDSELHPIREIDISDICVANQGSSTFYYDYMAIDKEENIYFYIDKKILVIDSEGSLKSRIAANCQFATGFVALNDSMAFVSTDKSSTLTIEPINLEEECLDEGLTGLSEFSSSTKVFNSTQGELYLFDGSSMYSYNPEKQECVEIEEWKNTNVGSSNIQFFIPIGSDFVFSNSMNSNNFNYYYEIAVAKRKRTEDCKEKTIITASIFTTDYILLNQIYEFNKYNPDYRIEPQIYVTDDSQVSKEDALRQFQIDLISGKAGDLIFVTPEMDYTNLSKKGAFADLFELMEKDETLDADNYIPNILELLTVDGKLCGIAPSFTINTLIGKTSVVGDNTNWTVTDISNIIKAHPDAMLLSNMDKNLALTMFLRYSMDSYYDSASGNCCFNGTEFKQVLELANSFPSPSDFEFAEDHLSNYSEEKILLLERYFFDLYDEQLFKALFDSEINYIGYPAREGSGTIARFGNAFFAIGASSQNKEGAWQFIRQYLTEDYQDMMYGPSTNGIGHQMPISKNVLEKKLEYAMENEPSLHIGYSNFYIEAESLSEQEVQNIRKLIYGISKYYSYDYAMLNIILEEADSYFAGQKTVDEVADIIQNRMQLYVNERS